MGAARRLRQDSDFESAAHCPIARQSGHGPSIVLFSLFAHAVGDILGREEAHTRIPSACQPWLRARAR
jgi:hypothetical protein